jgi:HEPN domain-containing protein
MKPLTVEWIEKAEGDFLVASQIMKRSKDRVLDAACFHCQQTVEK